MSIRFAARAVHPWGYISVAVALSGCANLPPFVPTQRPDSNVAVGPKVQEIVSNLHCQLRRAVNLPDVLATVPSDTSSAQPQASGPPRPPFTVPNILRQIEYVVDAKFTLDVKDNGSFSPLGVFTQPYRGAVGLLPATGLALTVGSTFSDQGHRSVDFSASIDLDKLLRESSVTAVDQTAPGTGRPHLDPCDEGLNLKGDLGLAETFAAGLMAAAQNSYLSVYQPYKAPAPGGNPNGGAGGGPYGQITATVDFQVIEGVSSSPVWTLKYFKGPGGASNGLFNIQRTVFDTLVVTFAPSCRQYDRLADDGVHPWAIGTPGWAVTLPPCPPPQGLPPPPTGATAQAQVDLPERNTVTPASHLTALSEARAANTSAQIINALQRLVPSQ
jgi:hypothetical protein